MKQRQGRKQWWNSGEDKKREKKAWLGSVLIHLIIFILLAVTGILSYTPLKKTNIIEVTAVGDAGGGAAGTKGGSAAEEAAPTAEQIGADAILQHSDKAKVKISYDELKEMTQPENTEKTEHNLSDNKDINQNKDNVTNTSAAKNQSSSGDSAGNANAGGGTGSGKASGNGSGTGTGKGSSGEGNAVDTNALYGENGVDVRPQFIKRVRPNYPQDLADDDVTGTVIVRVVLGKDGSIESASIAKSSGNRRLDNEALKAARQSTFTPAKIKNTPVRCSVNLPFTFN